MPSFRRFLACASLALAAFLAAAPVSAQSARTRVRQLTQEGMTAFHELDLERAEELLNQALAAAEDGHVDGTDLARVHLGLGVIAIGGYSDSQRGVDAFMRALGADSAIEPDPLTSTPEIQSAFQLARTRLASGGRPNANGSAPSIVHQPVVEQLVQTGVPIYVELQNGARVARTVVMYRAHGMRRFREITMQTVGNGLGVEIPCDEVFEGDFAYYVVAYDASDRVLAGVASEAQPLRVHIVQTRTPRAAVPALPGHPAPVSCAAPECPPGMTCGEETTPPPRVEPTTNAATPSSGILRPRFFLQVGGVVGAYRAAPGMQTDSLPNLALGSPGAASGPNAAYIPAGTGSCDTDPGTYCVRVSQSGMLPVVGGRLMIGYWLSNRVAIAAGARVGPGGGSSTLSFGMVQFQVRTLLTNPTDTRFGVALLVGMSTGQVQVRPQQVGAGVQRPWAQVGLGSAQLGVVVSYRFLNHLGFFTSLDGSVFFRRVNVGADFTLGLELAY